jgi:hypothetical protein
MGGLVHRNYLHNKALGRSVADGAEIVGDKCANLVRIRTPPRISVIDFFRDLKENRMLVMEHPCQDAFP